MEHLKSAQHLYLQSPGKFPAFFFIMLDKIIGEPFLGKLFFRAGDEGARGGGNVIGRAGDEGEDCILDADRLADAEAELRRGLVGAALGHGDAGFQRYLALFELLEKQIERHDLGQ